MDIALLLVRLIGIGFAAHGAQKLFGWFGGIGIAGTGGWMESIGFRPGKLFATAAGLSELAGGLLIAFGLGGPIGPLLAIAAMVVAISVHLPNGFFVTKNGYETALLYAAVAFGLTFTGFGAYSLDGALGIAPFWTPALQWTGIGLGVLAGLANVAARRKPVPAAADAA
jgi:putative oxidoreductase